MKIPLPLPFWEVMERKKAIFFNISLAKFVPIPWKLDRNAVLSKNMTFSGKRALLLSVTVLTMIGIWLLPPIAQPLSFHDLADKRTFWSIPNFWNVITNLPFLLVGLLGLAAMRRARVNTGLAVAYVALFTGITLTGIGSGYYHWAPDNNTLVWDRIPMTLVFMSLSAATWWPLVLFGSKYGKAAKNYNDPWHK